MDKYRRGPSTLLTIILTVVALAAIGTIVWVANPGNIRGLAVGAIENQGNGTTGNPVITCPSGYILQNGVCADNSIPATYQPSVTYQTKDKYSSTFLSGTAYYKADGSPAGTSSPTIIPGNSYEYWLSNSTYYTAPSAFTASKTGDNIVADAWANGSATISAYDEVAGTAIAVASHNASLGAGGKAIIDFKFTGTYKQSTGPFGGLMYVEANSTLDSMTCSGAGISTSNPMNFQYNYQVSNTADVYQSWYYPPTLDDGSATLQTITCNFKNGGTAQPTGGAYYVKWMPANYYYGNDGNIYLDVSQAANGLKKTLTGLQTVTFTGYWA